jgi:DNA-binding NarL/FixJ family response regulator
MTNLTTDQLADLRDLARGDTYEDMAHARHVTHRQLQYRLRKLYDCMGVHNRVGAIRMFLAEAQDKVAE